MSRPNDEQWWQQLDERVRQLVPPDKQALFVAMVRDVIESRDAASFWAQCLFTDQIIHGDESRVVVCKAGHDFYQAAIEAIVQHGEDFDYFIEYIRDKTGLDGKYLEMPLRIALTGMLHGPDLRLVFKLMDTDRAHLRLEQVMDLCHCH